MSPSNPARGNVRLVAQTWLGTRLVLVGVAVCVMLAYGKTVDQAFGNWDVQHFLGIAENGYVEQNSIAFFPGWPLILRGISAIGVPAVLGGTILAGLLSIVACAALYRMAGSAAAIAWLLAPTAVFTLVPYTESLFCAAAFWAWERASSKHWGAAAVLAAVATSVRVSGLFLIGALFILALTQKGGWGRRWLHALWLLIPAAVLGAYGVYTWVLTGDPLGWYHAQAAGWSRDFTWPWQSFMTTWGAALPGANPTYPEWSWIFRGEIISMAVGLAVTVVCLVRKRWAEGAWVGVQVVAFSLSTWFMSVNRAVLLWFPLWTNIGDLSVRVGTETVPRRVVLGVVVGLAVVLQGVWAWLFYTGQWAS